MTSSSSADQWVGRDNYDETAERQNPLYEKTIRWRLFVIRTLRSLVLCCSKLNGVALLTMLAMTSVGLGIMWGIFVSLSPLNTPRPIRLEVSLPKTYPNTTQFAGTYKPSPLEEYFLQNGRNEKLRFDRRIVQTTHSSSKAVSPFWFVPPLVPIMMVSSIFHGDNPNQQTNYMDRKTIKELPSGCDFWWDRSLTTPLVRGLLGSYEKQLREDVSFTQVTSKHNIDLRKEIGEGKQRCEFENTNTIYPDNSFLSMIQEEGGKHFGFIEPLLPPFGICNPDVITLLGTPELFWAHHFQALCQNRLHPNSKTLFVQIFEGRVEGRVEGRIEFAKDPYATLYQKFGFIFDAFEQYYVTGDPIRGYEHRFNEHLVPMEGQDIFPVSLESILRDYKDSDFVVFHIDTSALGKNLHQWFTAGGGDSLSKIDALHLFHPVTMKEYAPIWKDSMADSSIQDALELVTYLRKQGIYAHY